MRRVVITGIGMVSPVGNNVSSSWKKALKGKSGVDKITSFDTNQLDVKIAAEVREYDPLDQISPREIRKIARFSQFAISATQQALDDAQLPKDKDPTRQGCSIGVGIGDITNIYKTSGQFQKTGQKKVSPFFVPIVIANMAAGNTSNHFGLKGPNICPTTACASGTHAIGEGWLYIKNNMADVMICGGAESAINELTVSGFSNMKALSKTNDNPQEASRPFDIKRNGFVLGEGAGILVLEEYEHARRRNAKIYAEMTGYGLSGDAHHITAPSPRGEGAQRCMEMACKSAGINLSQVNYINAHGTSTKYNDLFETQAIIEVFGEQAKSMCISSTKGVTGHCLGAAGGIEGVFLAKSIYEQKAPPTANLTEPDPECSLDYVPGDARDWLMDAGLSNSFGFGGTNASILFQKMS